MVSAGSLVFAKSSVLSLRSIITAMAVRASRKNKNVTKYFLSIYQSRIFIPQTPEGELIVNYPKSKVIKNNEVKLLQRS